MDASAMSSATEDRRAHRPAGELCARAVLAACAGRPPTAALSTCRLPSGSAGRSTRRRLETSLRRLIARHEILRTGFEDLDGTLSQVIAPAAPFDLLETSLEHISSSEQSARIKQDIRRESSLAFDLSTPPLMRAHLFRLAPEAHVFVLTLHDIVSDAQSVANPAEGAVGDLRCAVGGSRARPARDRAAIWRLRDLAARVESKAKTARAQLDFWRHKLANPLPVLDFPLDRLPSPDQQKDVGLETQSLPDELVAVLRQLAQAQNATMFAVTGAAFAILLARYARQSDVLFGSPVANRTSQTETMLGRLAGPMALRLDLSGDPTLLDVVIARTRCDLRSTWQRELPIRADCWSTSMRALIDGRNPLFQFHFLYQLAFMQEQRTKTLRIEPMQSLGIGTTFELQLALIERPNGVTAQLEYNPALLDAATVEERAQLLYLRARSPGFASTQRISSLKEPNVASVRRVAA